MTLFSDLLNDPERPRIYLVDARPYDPTAGAVTRRGFSSGALTPLYDGIAWPAMLEVALSFRNSINTADRALGGDGTPDLGTIDIAISDGTADELSDLLWAGRDITVLMGA